MWLNKRAGEKALSLPPLDICKAPPMGGYALPAHCGGRDAPTPRRRMRGSYSTVCTVTNSQTLSAVLAVLM